jgi:hypothetical protein
VASVPLLARATLVSGGTPPDLEKINVKSKLRKTHSV